MTAQDIIREVQENTSEWLEMSNDPYAIVAGVLANKILKMQSQITYLEKRLDYVTKCTSNTANRAG